MSTILQNKEILNSFTGEIEKNALNFGKILSKINPFRRFGKKAVEKGTKAVAQKSRATQAMKEFATIPLVGGSVVGIGALAGPKLPPLEKPL